MYVVHRGCRLFRRFSRKEGICVWWDEWESVRIEASNGSLLF